MHCSQFRRCANLMFFLIFRRCDVAPQKNPPPPPPSPPSCGVLLPILVHSCAQKKSSIPVPVYPKVEWMLYGADAPERIFRYQEPSNVVHTVALQYMCVKVNFRLPHQTHCLSRCHKPDIFQPQLFFSHTNWTFFGHNNFYVKKTAKNDRNGEIEI